MEEFSIGVFANADKEDRASPIQPPAVALAGRFYISALFFDVVAQFHEGILPPDLEEKRRYAKYRTLQIRNRQPLDSPSEASKDALPTPVAPPSAVSSGFKYASEEEPKARAPTVATSPVKESYRRHDPVAARKKLQQAISAIEFSDFATAISLSMDAINLLDSH